MIDKEWTETMTDLLVEHCFEPVGPQVASNLVEELSDKIGATMEDSKKLWLEFLKARRDRPWCKILSDYIYWLPVKKGRIYVIENPEPEEEQKAPESVAETVLLICRKCHQPAYRIRWVDIFKDKTRTVMTLDRKYMEQKSTALKCCHCGHDDEDYPFGSIYRTFDIRIEE